MKIYETLYKLYGPQGWWPIVAKGYRKGVYDFHKTQEEIFEIALGVILTQNTTFTSVEKSLSNLYQAGYLSYKRVIEMPIDVLKESIRPCGYFNQKTEYILNFTDLFHALEGKTPTRKELLAVKGIGEESADSILLYAYNLPEFVIDAYTKRIFIHLELVGEKVKYKELKELIESQIKIENEQERVILYQEFHALIVAHAKRFYSKKPYGENCPLEEQFLRM